MATVHMRMKPPFPNPGSTTADVHTRNFLVHNYRTAKLYSSRPSYRAGHGHGRISLPRARMREQGVM